MEKITKVTEADVGCVAVSEDGHFRVKILSVEGDNPEVEYLKNSYNRDVGYVTDSFILVGGDKDMYWEDSQEQVKPKKDIWFETEPAIFTYGIDVVKSVLRQAFGLSRAWGWASFDEYLDYFGNTLNDKGHVNGIDRVNDFNGCGAHYSGELLSFEEFAERLGIEIEPNKEVEVKKPALRETVFTLWCKENGYDPLGEFVYDKEKTVPELLNRRFSIEDVLEILEDDNSRCPRFINQDGNGGYENFNDGGVFLKAKSQVKGQAKPRFRKPRQKQPVRQKTDVVIQYKTGETYTLKNVNSVSVSLKQITITVLKEIEEGIRIHVHNDIKPELVAKITIKTPGYETEVHNYSDDEFLVYFENGYCIVRRWFKNF